MITNRTQKYVARVLRGDFPEDPEVPLDDTFNSDAGLIVNLVNAPVGGVQVLHSKMGAVRANHYHKTDWHFAYVVTGWLHYFWQAQDVVHRSERFDAGQMIFTPPGVPHAFLFGAETVCVTVSRLSRSHENHEADVVRVPSLVGPDAVKWLLRSEDREGF